MITQIARKTNHYVVFWYNAQCSMSIMLIYLLVRLKLSHETQSERLKNSVYWQEPVLTFPLINWDKDRMKCALKQIEKMKL